MGYPGRDPVSNERWGREGEEKREARGRERAGTGKTGEFPPRPACRAVVPGSPSPTDASLPSAFATSGYLKPWVIPFIQQTL